MPTNPALQCSSRTPHSGDTTAELPGNGDEPLHPLHLSASLQLQAAGRRDYSCRLIRAGRIRRADDTPGPYEIPAEAIQTAVDAGKFNSKAAFVDHAGWFDGPSLRNLAGITLAASYNATDAAAEATIRLYDSPGRRPDPRHRPFPRVLSPLETARKRRWNIGRRSPRPGRVPPRRER